MEKFVELLLSLPLWIWRIIAWILLLLGVYYFSKYLQKIILQASYANAFNSNETNEDFKISTFMGEDCNRYSIWVVNLFFDNKISEIRFRLQCSENYYYIVNIPLKLLTFNDKWNLAKTFLISKRLRQLSKGANTKIFPITFSKRLVYLLNSELYRANKRYCNSDSN